ncbi:MAG: (Fe-S)-binding protein [Methylococcales bacterium]
MKSKELFTDTDLCVKCGLCVSHCPTYRKTLDENESPRGRISLIQAWAAGDLENTPALNRHIDNCLLCGTCESVCPAKVPYSRIVDRFRSAAGKSEHSIRGRGLSVLSGIVLANRRVSGIALRAARMLPRKVIALLAGQWRATRILQSLLADIDPRGTRAAFHPTRFPKQGLVGLFKGCTGDWFDAESIDATIRVLNRLGYDVSIPPLQNCCGALHLHAGDVARARKLAAGNLRAFGLENFDAIITLASGCGAMLKRYPDYFPDSQHFSSNVVDICAWVQGSADFSNMPLEALRADILIHNPCSLTNVLKSSEAPRKLIEAIPGARVSMFDKSLGCCGAAGNYMLEHPEMAAALRDDFLNSIAAENPDCVLTSNVGCALHIRAGMRQHAIETEVVHPIVLFDRQIRARETG